MEFIWRSRAHVCVCEGRGVGVEQRFATVREPTELATEREKVIRNLLGYTGCNYKDRSFHGLFRVRYFSRMRLSAFTIYDVFI